MRLGEFTFKPALIPTLVTLLLLPILLSLGFWQLDRASQKKALQVSFKAQIDAPYVSVVNMDLANPASRYRRVMAEGRYD